MISSTNHFVFELSHESQNDLRLVRKHEKNLIIESKIPGNKTLATLVKNNFIEFFSFCPSFVWQRQPPEVLHKKGVLKSFAKLTGKRLHQSLLFNKVVFSCKFCEIMKNLSSEEHPQMVASVPCFFPKAHFPYSFGRFARSYAETVPFTKFPHREIRWNYGIFRIGRITLMILQ